MFVIACRKRVGDEFYICVSDEIKKNILDKKVISAYNAVNRQKPVSKGSSLGFAWIKRAAGGAIAAKRSK